jgi:3-deoxy-D-manno-octulosonic-acid transferase
VAKKLPKTKLIIAPHDLHRVPHLQKLFPNAILYSSLTNSHIPELSNSQTLIIDSIGKLSKLYSYADLAVVGGGFHSAGLHNILEAAVYGVPVIFGNQYKKNPEADTLIEAKGAKCFDDFVAASALSQN